MDETAKLLNGCMVEGDFIPCVFDDPAYNVDDCNYAPELQRSGKGRDSCPYWKPDEIPVDAKAVDELAELRAENARLLQSALASQRDADKLMEKLHAAERELDCAVETAEANIRAEIADGGKSCHWCRDSIARDIRGRYVELIREQVTTVSVYPTAAEAKAATELKERIATLIENQK